MKHTKFKRGDKVVVNHPWDGTSLSGKRYAGIVAFRYKKGYNYKRTFEVYGVVAEHDMVTAGSFGGGWVTTVREHDMSTEFVSQYDYSKIDISKFK